MINEAFETVHLKERKVSSVLFGRVKEAFIGASNGYEFQSRHLVIESSERLPENIFREGPICPVYLHQGRSYIIQEGDSLDLYFLARRKTDLVLYEEEIWALLRQIATALLVLSRNDLPHRHIRQHAIRRIRKGQFRLLYHPAMRTMQSLVAEGAARWYQFYPAPQQLDDLTLQASNSCVFSLGAMVLKLMNPLDSGRDIYSRQEFCIDQHILAQKLGNANKMYSQDIISLLRRMLEQHYEKRLTLEEMLQIVDKLNPQHKKQNLTASLRTAVHSKLNQKDKRSPLKKNPSPQETSRVISFERGTFGGGRQQTSDSESEPHEKEESPQPIGHSSPPKKQLNKNVSLKTTIGKELQPANRSYSEQFNTIKKTQDSPPTKTEADTTHSAQQNLQSVHHDSHSDLPSAFQPNPAVHQTYNQYIQSSQGSRKIAFPPKQPGVPSLPQFANIRIEEEEEKTEYQGSPCHTSENGDRSRSRREAEDNEGGKVMEQSIQKELRLFKSRIQGFKLQHEDCLEETKVIAARLGYPGVWQDGSVYYGWFDKGRRNGLALEVFPNGQYYYGHYKDDLFHGEGFYFWNTRQHFLGLFEDGRKKEGTWWGASVYEGQIKENRRHGIGTIIYPNGSIYKGEWYCGKRQGQGIVIEPSKDIFIGTFRAGLKEGYGTYLISNCRFSGFWKGELPQGDIQIVYPEGRHYLGQINHHFQMHGKGELRFSNGTRAVGLFQEDQLVEGEMFYCNGEHYAGQFRNLTRHGEGTYTYSSGQTFRGRWVNNERQPL